MISSFASNGRSSISDKATLRNTYRVNHMKLPFFYMAAVPIVTILVGTRASGNELQGYEIVAFTQPR